MNVLVCVVCSFQGEESTVVIVSLVRSNPQGKIGFLKCVHILCVPGSRILYPYDLPIIRVQLLLAVLASSTCPLLSP